MSKEVGVIGKLLAVDDLVLCKVLRDLGIPRRFLYMKNHLDMLRVVYGGQYTILIDNYSGDRICKVIREKGVKNDLTKAVLYLLLKTNNVYGKEIERYIHSGYHCGRMPLMEYLLQYGYRDHYTKEDVDKYMDIITSEEDLENGFMYMLLYDRYLVERADVENLINNATCSETDKTRLRMLKKRKNEKRTRSSKKTIKSREELEML